MDPGSHRRVQRLQDFLALGLLGGDGHAYRPPGGLHQLLIPLRQIVATLVEYRQAHHPELHLDVANLLNLEDPPRGDPAPRT
ncbi:Uncharacterised protein [Mycobacteroides abscessus subsp. massiliense]|nr:Uncharacterised protein [Mycobacteroides abscessus subsp. massiliense]